MNERCAINLYNMDCMDALREMEDNQFDLAIVDPPYGINAGADPRRGIKHKTAATHRKDYGNKDWDKNTPDDKYFSELKRISKNQIIWGVNYYDVIFGSGRIFWDKDTSEKYSNSDGELAYQSFGKGLKKFKFTWNGMIQNNMKEKEIRIHPTQKPVALYKWLLKNYAKEGDKILDTHGGSMSITLACWDMGFDLDLYELDKDYFEAGKNRLKNHQAQGQLF